MIEITDCIKGLSLAIEEIYEAPPVSKDMTEFSEDMRPCTILWPSDIRTEQDGAMRVDTVEMTIVRFAALSYLGYKDILQSEIALRELLCKPVAVRDGFLLYPEALRFTPSVTDNCLEVKFSFTNVQLDDPNSSEPDEEMDTLITNL